MSLIVLQQKVQTALTQIIQENLNVFNQASNNTLMLTSDVGSGDTIEQLSWGLISGLVSDRNAYAAAGTPAFHKVLTQLQANKIVMSGRVGPLVVTNGMLKKLNQNIDQIAAQFSADAAQMVLQKYVRVAFGAALGAISTNPAAVRTQSAPIAPTAPVGSLFPTLREMELTAALFGDQSSNISAWLMTGMQYSALQAYDVIDNPHELFTIDGVRVVSDANGRRFVVSDALNSGNRIVGLTQAAVVVGSSGQDVRTGQDIGGENVTNIIRADFDYSVAVKGYRVKASVAQQYNGIKSYDEAAATNAANWELVANVGQDNAPNTIDGVNPNVSNAGGKGGNTGTLMQQDPQGVIPISVKETAGVIMTLTPSTVTNQTVAGS